MNAEKGKRTAALPQPVASQRQGNGAGTTDGIRGSGPDRRVQSDIEGAQQPQHGRSSMNHLARRATLVILLTAVFVFGAAASAFAAKIVYAKNGDIYTVNTDGTGTKRITKGASVDKEPVWSADHRRVYFLRSDTAAYKRVDRICYVPASGGKVRTFSFRDPEGLKPHAKSSLTVGKGKLFFADYYRAKDTNRYRVISLDLKTHASKRVYKHSTVLKTPIRSLDASSDGKRLLFVRRETDLTLIKLGSGAVSHPQSFDGGLSVVAAGYDPKVRSIGYSTSGETTDQAGLLGLRGRLVADSEYHTWPSDDVAPRWIFQAWSGGGKRILYAISTPGVGTELWTFDWNDYYQTGNGLKYRVASGLPAETTASADW